MNTWNEHLFFVSGAPQVGPMFRVRILDGINELRDVTVYAVDSGVAADKVLDQLKHPEETRLEVLVTGR